MRKWERILILEPSQVLQRRLAAGLEQLGQTPVCFQRASALLRYLQMEPRPAVVVADCFVPDMDLFSFLNRYAEMEEPHAETRLILTCTETYPPPELRPQILSNGADYYMIKPYTAQMLLENIQRLYSSPVPAHMPGVHPAIVDFLRRQGLPLEHVSFWYIASAIQLEMNAGMSMPLKSLYIELGRLYGVSPQGVESGLRRMGKVLTRVGVFEKAPSPKQLIAALASAFVRERSESRDDTYALET